MKNKILLGMMFWAVLWFSSGEPGFAAEDKVIGSINWAGGFITASGQGTADSSSNRVLDQMMATRAATVSAQRALLEIIKGVRIDSTTRVENMMVQQDTIIAQVSGVIRGAQVMKTDTQWIGAVPMVTVEMRLCLNEDQCHTGKSLLSALDLSQRPEPPHVPPQRFSLDPAPAAPPAPGPPPGAAPAGAPPAPGPPPSAAPAGAPTQADRPKFSPFDSSKPVTGLVLDLEGRFFERELLPVVVTIGEDRTPFTVYSVKYVVPKVIRTDGVVRYADSVDQAKKNSNLGDNILVIPVENITRENMLIIHRDSARKIRETTSHGNDYLGNAKVVIADK